MSQSLTGADLWRPVGREAKVAAQHLHVGRVGWAGVPQQVGVHAVHARSGRILGSLIWPFGNQIFAIAAVPDRFTRRLPIIGTGRGEPVDEQTLFYGFTT